MDLIPEPYSYAVLALAITIQLAGVTCEAIRFLRDARTADDTLRAARLNRTAGLLLLASAAGYAVADSPVAALLAFTFACSTVGTSVELRQRARRLRRTERAATAAQALKLGLPMPTTPEWLAGSDLESPRRATQREA